MGTLIAFPALSCRNIMIAIGLVTDSVYPHHPSNTLKLCLKYPVSTGCAQGRIHGCPGGEGGGGGGGGGSWPSLHVLSTVHHSQFHIHTGNQANGINVLIIIVHVLTGTITICCVSHSIATRAQYVQS